MIVRWLSITLFLLFAAPLAMLLFLFFFRPDAIMHVRRIEPFKLTEVQRRICETSDDDRLIRAAVDSLIRLAVTSRDEGRPLKDIWFPYFTYEDYRAANPDCCIVHSDRPGDYPQALNPFFRGELDPKIYVVDFTFKTNINGVNHKNSEIARRSALVTCYGENIPEDHLLGILWRAGRSTN